LTRQATSFWRFTDAGSALRWILVLPAAVLGFVVAQLLVILVTAFVPWGVVSRQTSAFITPAAFVVLGTRAAPAYKVHTAGVLAIVMLFAQGMFWGIALVVSTSLSLQENALGALLGVVGTIFGLYFVYRQQRSDTTVEVQ